MPAFQRLLILTALALTTLTRSAPYPVTVDDEYGIDLYEFDLDDFNAANDPDLFPRQFDDGTCEPGGGGGGGGMCIDNS